ncbi:MAG: hypothetical protein DMF94_22535 [Acidobacteria bacterium]|nr:MAG: hypothetical protein DMF94_22535 [Acidobacteriota bacterium]
MRVMLVSALTIGVAVAVARASQQGPPQLSPATEELAKRFPYPVIRDQRGVIPPGPRPLPSPPLGDGGILIPERAGRLRILRNGVLDPAPVAGTPQVLSRGTMAGLMDIGAPSGLREE